MSAAPEVVPPFAARLSTGIWHLYRYADGAVYLPSLAGAGALDQWRRAFPKLSTQPTDAAGYILTPEPSA